MATDRAGQIAQKCLEQEINMRYYWLIIIFLAFGAFYSCDTDLKQLPVTGHQKFDSLLRLHFPKGRPMFDVATFPYIQDELFIPEDFLHTGAYYRATYSLSSNELAELKKSLDGHEKVLNHDECCFICQGDKSGTYRMECSEFEVPVSLFALEREQLGIDGAFLSSDFDLYIVDAEEGSFVPSRNLINRPCSNFWDHGFSRGLAISEGRGVVIYWIEFW
ncbi:MAG: hypothetical protein R8G66_27245 [Cytophagales bacterium]|nr:hypothetical protein [Cytophagales bacterium]